MDISWVFLIDVPQQRDEWYFEMLTWLPLITHLAPPVYATPIQFVRFSPYHRDAASYGFDLVPERTYAQIYPLAPEEMEQLAYYFVERESGAARELRAAVARRVARHLARSARRRPPRPVLEMWRNGDVIDIIDTRSCRTADQHRLHGLSAIVYTECDEAIDRSALLARLAVDPVHFADVVASLIADKLLLDFNGRLLAIAVDASRPRPAETPNPGGNLHWDLVLSAPLRPHSLAAGTIAVARRSHHGVMADTAGARFDRLVEVMRTLRSPQGCPWDREQTLSSLRPYVLEETYELLDALDRGDRAALSEELGDFLYEAVFLAQICRGGGALLASATRSSPSSTSWSAVIRTCLRPPVFRWPRRARR